MNEFVRLSKNVLMVCLEMQQIFVFFLRRAVPAREWRSRK